MPDDEHKTPEIDPDENPMSDDDAISDLGEELREMGAFDRNRTVHHVAPLSKGDELQRQVRSLAASGDEGLREILKEFTSDLVPKNDLRFRRLDKVLKDTADLFDHYFRADERDRAYYGEEMAPAFNAFLDEEKLVLGSLERTVTSWVDDFQAFNRCVVRCIKLNDGEVNTSAELEYECGRIQVAHESMTKVTDAESKLLGNLTTKRFYERLEADVEYWDDAFGSEPRWFVHADVEQIKSWYDEIDVQHNYIQRSEPFYTDELKRLMRREKSIDEALGRIELAKSSSVVPPEDVLAADSDPWMEKYVKALGGGPEVSKGQIAKCIQKTTEVVRLMCKPLTPVAGYRKDEDGKRIPVKGVRYDCLEVAMLLAKKRKGN